MNPWDALFVASVKAAGIVLGAAYLWWFAGRCVRAHRREQNQ